MRFVDVIALLLVIIGALNWGLWGFAKFDFVAWLFHGNTTFLSRLVYAIVGLAGLWSIGFFGKCTCCLSGKKGDKCKPK